MKKVIVITNIPSPYRVLFFNEIASIIKYKFSVIYCAKIESNRKWNLPDIKHEHLFLDEKKIIYKNRTIYYNFSIWSKLKEIKPDVIVTGGFNPTMLLAILYAWIYNKKHFITTDSWSKTEEKLSLFHKLIRKFIYRKASAFLPVSEKGKINIQTYGIQEYKIHICPYIVDNEKFKIDSVNKEYDLMYSGQFIPRKMPFFFLDIVRELNKKRENLRILILGDGPLKKEILHNLDEIGVDYHYPGFVQPVDLPEYYGKSKIYLFPTEEDAWGVVANEACAAGLPVITCENAGAAKEIIKDGINGYVLPINVDIWVNKILYLLDNETVMNNFKKNSFIAATQYSKNHSANNFIKACESVLE